MFFSKMCDVQQGWLAGDYEIWQKKKRESRNIQTNQDSRFDWCLMMGVCFALMVQRMYKDLATIGVQNSK